MDALLHIGMAAAVSTVLSALAYRMRLLTGAGALSSFAIGMIIGVLGSLYWLLTLISFTFAGFVVTRIDLAEKARLGLQEGRHGERGHVSVLAVGAPLCILALLSFIGGEHTQMAASVGYISMISVAASDTVASELGTKHEKVWLITSFKRVPAGTDGGVSVMGTLWALAGAAAASVLGWVIIFPHELLSPLLLVPVLAGFAGCLMDSVVGATLEARGLVSKYGNNALTMLFGGALGILAAVLL